MKSLYVRVVLTLVCIVCMSGIMGFLVANGYYQQNLRSYNEQNPSQDLHLYLTRIANMNFQIYLVDETGRGTLFGAPFHEREIDPAIAKRVLSGQVYRGISEEEHGLFVTGFFQNTLQNSIGLPMRANGKAYALFLRTNIEEQFGEVHILFTILLAATFLISILFILVFTGYLVKPIKRLTKATRKLAEGNYQIELDISRKDEIGDLATNFAQMTQSLKQLEEMRQVLLMLEQQWQEKRLEIDLELRETLIYADQQMLSQVWINLGTEAARGVGTCITVRLPGGYADKIRGSGRI